MVVQLWAVTPQGDIPKPGSPSWPHQQPSPDPQSDGAAVTGLFPVPHPSARSGHTSAAPLPPEAQKDKCPTASSLPVAPGAWAPLHSTLRAAVTRPSSAPALLLALILMSERLPEGSIPPGSEPRKVPRAQPRMTGPEGSFTSGGSPGVQGHTGVKGHSSCTTTPGTFALPSVFLRSCPAASQQPLTHPAPCPTPGSPPALPHPVPAPCAPFQRRL